MIPSKEKKIFLGAIWSSVIFENRAPSNQAGFTIFIGGARNSDIFRRFGNDLEQKVLGEFQRIHEN
ncbi:MAG: hypothetical protein IPN18_08100 [Ignavibacteriales bacterium]|nr:hypothetical protein [Ignavibacteriales bacterium]